MKTKTADPTKHNITTTHHTIDKVTYIIMSRPSDTATDTIEQKIDKLIIKNIRQSADNANI